MKAWLRKWWGPLLLTAGFLGLLATWNPEHGSSTPFLIGPSQPEGSVKPQLTCCWHGVVLLAPDGSLWAWGGTQVPLTIIGTPTLTSKPLRIGTGSDWLRIAAATSTILAVKTNGTLWGWGYSAGELLTITKTTPLPLTQLGTDDDWRDVHMGHGQVLALKRDGSLWAWGRNTHGAVGDGSRTNVLTPTRISSHTTWRAVSAVDFNSYGIQADGSLWGWGPGIGYTPTLLDPATNWMTLAAGDFSLLAVKSNGTLWVRGQNARFFAPGSGARSGTAMVQVGSDTDWREVFAGQGYFIARKTDGSWWGCGNNEHGQLGLGYTSRRPVPTPTRLPLRFEPWAFATTSIGGTTALFARDGTVWTWGVRAGMPVQRSRIDHLREWWDRQLRGGSGGIVTFRPVFTHDTQPHLVWELPPSVKGALGTNAPSQPKPAQ